MPKKQPTSIEPVTISTRNPHLVRDLDLLLEEITGRPPTTLVGGSFDVVSSIYSMVWLFGVLARRNLAQLG